MIVHDDRALDREPRPHADLGIRPDARGDDDEIAGKLAAVLEPKTRDFIVARHFGGGLADMNVDVHALDRLLQNATAGIVELHLHQMAGEVDDMRFTAEDHHAARGFEPQQAAADGHRHPALPRVIDDGAAVIEASIAEDARLELSIVHPNAFDGRNERAAARRDEKLVIGLADAALGGDDPRGTVDLVDPLPRMKRDPMVRIPVERVDQDFIRRLRPVEDVRQHDPIVIAIRFVPKHHDVEKIGAAARKDLFDRAGARHSVSDDNEFLLGHESGPLG